MSFEAIYRDGAFYPLARFHNSVAALYGEGECVTLEREEPRSWKSHGHFFACVNAAHDNLPEGEAERFATPDHLRKWALIRAGYRNEVTIACASKAEAARTVSTIKALDDYAVCVVRDALVVIWTAKSQSVKAMGKADFQASKDAVLGVLAELIGSDPTTLRKAANDTTSSEGPARGTTPAGVAA